MIISMIDNDFSSFQGERLISVYSLNFFSELESMFFYVWKIEVYLNEKIFDLISANNLYTIYSKESSQFIWERFKVSLPNHI